MKKGQIIFLAIAMLVLPIIAISIVWLLLKKNVFDNPEFWYGYMSYFGTIALAVVALWQNHIFKIENDKSQIRLENISKKANEISVISKIIEHEEVRLQELKVSFDELFDICDPVYILSEIKDKSPEESSEILIRLQKKLDVGYNRIFNCLSWNTNDDRKFKYSIVSLYSATFNMIMETRNKGYSDVGQDVFDKRFETRDIYDKYYRNYQTKLETLLYSHMSLEEVYEIYKRDEDEDDEQA